MLPANYKAPPLVSHQNTDSGNKYWLGASYWGQCFCVSLEFENLVSRFYRPLYQFAFSLTRREAEACDLTQQTFYLWATKGHQLRDESKVKSWLFTSLHRQFLESCRRATRFPHLEISQAEGELPDVPPARESLTDSQTVTQALAQIDAIYQAPVALFYLEDYSYKEIASILDIPMGTVKSRIARGIGQLQKALPESTSGRTSPGRDE
jgi:RNA polymerase sigma-70 factor (ECF subfamily)